MKQGHHHQLLFHWIGSDIEQKLRAKQNPISQEEANKLYIDHLRGSIQNGLWLNKTREQEFIGSRKIALDRPITCFTEWSLRNSQTHTHKYGRLGFGFTRAWVVARGGQPVTYVRPAKNSAYTSAAERLHGWISRLKDEDPMKKDLRAALGTILHYSRSLRDLPSTPTEPSGKATKKRVSKAPRQVAPLQRKWPAPMPLVEEREWRIVHTAGLKLCVANTNKTANTPSYYLPYTTGTELFTLVVPNNEILQEVVQDNRLRKQLFPAERPHVSLLSWQDLGSF